MHLRLSIPFVLLILTACGGGGGGNKPSTGASSVSSNAVTASSEAAQTSSTSESVGISSQAAQSASSDVIVAMSSASSVQSATASSIGAISSVADNSSSEVTTSSAFSSVEASSSSELSSSSEASSSSELSSSSEASSSSSFPGMNVLLNGGLEESAAGEADPLNWSTMLVQGAAAVFSVDATEQLSGNNSFKIAINTLPADSQPHNIKGSVNPIGVVSGASYQFSGWIKGNAGAEVQFIAGLATAPYTGLVSAPVSLAGDWQKVILDVTVPVNVNVIAVDVAMNYSTNVGAEIYLDDFSLVGPEVEPVVGASVMINGDLENAVVGDTEIASWETRVGNGSAAVFAVTDNEAHDGTKSLRVAVNDLSSDNPSPQDIQVAQAGFPVIAESTFGFSGWIKGAVGTKVDVTIGLTESPYTEYGKEDGVVMTGDWQEVIIPFNVPAQGVTVLRAVVDLNIEGNAGQVFYVDDFSAIFVE